MDATDTTSILERILHGAHIEPDRPRPCGATDWTIDAPADGAERCDGLSHITDGRVLRRCPALVLAEIRKRYGARAELARGRGFETHDLERYRPGDVEAERREGKDPAREAERRVRAAQRALDAMRAFAGARRPPCGVAMSGETGTGKTRLLLSSHFLRLELGWPSVYVTAGELRTIFADAENLDDAVHGPARGKLDSLSRARAVHLDDLGDVAPGSPAQHKPFADGIKTLLDAWDLVGARLAVALNLRSSAARAHPDLGDRVLSRLCAGAELVGIEGEDQRLVERHVPGPKNGGGA